MMYAADPRVLWELTAYELEELAEAGEARRAAAAREYEQLAYNIGALVLAAVNAPQRYPKSCAEAFGRNRAPAADGGKAAFMCAAERINRRFADRGEQNDS